MRNAIDLGTSTNQFLRSACQLLAVHPGRLHFAVIQQPMPRQRAAALPVPHPATGGGGDVPATSSELRVVTDTPKLYQLFSESHECGSEWEGESELWSALRKWLRSSGIDRPGRMLHKVTNRDGQAISSRSWAHTVTKMGQQGGRVYRAEEGGTRAQNTAVYKVRSASAIGDNADCTGKGQSASARAAEFREQKKREMGQSRFLEEEAKRKRLQRESEKGTAAETARKEADRKRHNALYANLRECRMRKDREHQEQPQYARTVVAESRREGVEQSWFVTPSKQRHWWIGPDIKWHRVINTKFQSTCGTHSVEFAVCSGDDARRVFRRLPMRPVREPDTWIHGTRREISRSQFEYWLEHPTLIGFADMNDAVVRKRLERWGPIGKSEAHPLDVASLDFGGSRIKPALRDTSVILVSGGTCPEPMSCRLKRWLVAKGRTRMPGAPDWGSGHNS